MDKTFSTFASFKEADEADLEFYFLLSPAERCRIAMQLMEPYYAASPGLERVYRVAEHSQRPIHDSWGLGDKSSGNSSNDG